LQIFFDNLAYRRRAVKNGKNIGKQFAKTPVIRATSLLACFRDSLPRNHTVENRVIHPSKIQRRLL
jgi:hypothetical protein